MKITLFSPLLSMSLLLGLGAAMCAQSESPVDEVQVNILPKKGMKFDPAAIYQEEAAVLQGIFGTSADDEVTDMASLASRQIVAVGRVGVPAGLPAAIPRVAISGLSGNGNTFFAVFDPTFRKLEKLAFLPADVATLRCVRIGKDGAVYIGGESAGPEKGLVVLKFDAELSRLIWRAGVRGDQMTGMAVMADNSVVVAPNSVPFISRLKPDGSGLIPFGKEERFRTDAGNPQIHQKYWVESGYVEKGYGGAGYHRGGAGGVVATQDGNLVFFTTNFVRLPGGGPDFDPMLIKFTPDGEVLWATNLLQGLPAESDHKDPRLYLDPYSGDLILTCCQHGAFARNLIVTQGCYLTTEHWFTGNIKIAWIGRVDAATGKVKAGTMYFPDSRKPPEQGKKFANSLIPEAVRTDAAGRIYVTGATAYKLATTLYAFQPETLGGTAFLSVFDSSLTSVLYSNLITAKGFGMCGNALEITPLGPVVATGVNPEKPPHHLVVANPDKTNFLKPDAAGARDVMFSLLPSKNWFGESP